MDRGRDILYAGQVVTSEVRAAPPFCTAEISPTLNHTLPAPSQVLMSLPSGTRAM